MENSNGVPPLDEVEQFQKEIFFLMRRHPNLLDEQLCRAFKGCINLVYNGPDDSTMNAFIQAMMEPGDG